MKDIIGRIRTDVNTPGKKECPKGFLWTQNYFHFRKRVS